MQNQKAASINKGHASGNDKDGGGGMPPKTGKEAQAMMVVVVVAVLTLLMVVHYCLSHARSRGERSPASEFGSCSDCDYFDDDHDVLCTSCQKTLAKMLMLLLLLLLLLMRRAKGAAVNAKPPTRKPTPSTALAKHRHPSNHRPVDRN
ncbi:GH13115 [Drosophila grimshawi]|uniref:GH13115 n=1 Tax=Drosophila grimshawi TaxID=7222 RepID=B4JQU4_DROGR|nr:GH13115 [Drosophila grimshawi]